MDSKPEGVKFKNGKSEANEVLVNDDLTPLENLKVVVKENPQIRTLRIESFEDRNNVIIALANAGYKTWIEEVKTLLVTEYFVYYEDK